jgi:hypothetical protein
MGIEFSSRFLVDVHSIPRHFLTRSTLTHESRLISPGYPFSVSESMLTNSQFLNPVSMTLPLPSWHSSESSHISQFLQHIFDSSNILPIFFRHFLPVSARLPLVLDFDLLPG